MQKRLMFVAFLLMAICSKIVADDQLTISSFSLYHGVSKEVSVELTNSDAYVGFQFDLYLPDGVTVESYGGSADRLPSGTTPQMAQQSDGGYRFIAAALGGNTITGSSGAVMTITLRAGEGVATGDYTAYMRNVKISKADGSGLVAAEQPIAISVKGAEPYFVLSSDNTVLSFYYDTQIEARGGQPISSAVMTDSPTAVVNWSGHMSTITSVVFDGSFDDYLYVSNTRSWFQNCVNLTSITGLQYLHTDNVSDMMYMFYGCAKLTSLDLSSFNTSNVTSMQGMFAGCTGLTTLNLGSFNTAKVDDMSYMFYGDTGLKDITFGDNFSTASVINMYGMFAQCTGLTTIDLSKFSTASANYLSYMFAYCSGLTSIDVSHFDTSKATDISGMFGYCSALTSIDVSSFNTTNVTAMSGLFTNCNALTTLDVSSFNTAKVTTMGGSAADDGMFSQCANLTTIYAGSGWNTEAVAEGRNMFTGSTKLVGGAGTVYDASHTDHLYARIDGGTASPGYLTPGSGYGKVATPTFSWSGDSLTISSSTPDAEIWYTMSAAGSTAVPDTMLYTASLHVITDVRITAVAKKVNWTNSDIVELDYPGATWQTLTAAIAAANNAIEQGQGNERVNPTQITELQTIVASAGQMYGERTATVDAINGMVNDLTTATAAIMELVNAVDEPYALLDGQTLTFYYDKNKIPLSGMAVGPFTSDAQRPWNAAAATITTVVFDDSFAAHRPTATAFWFSGFTALTTLSGLDNLNTSEVTYMDGMFTNCSSLKTLYVSNNWDLSKVTSSISMFNNCTSLVGGQWTAYASSMTTATYARIDGGSAAPGYFTSIADNAEVAPVTYSRSGHTVTLSSTTANTHIMYTLSTWPLVNNETQWQQYTQPLALTEDCTITAYAVRPSGLRSADTEFNFVLNANFVEAPTIVRDGEENRVVITNNSTTGTVYYNYDANGQLTATNSSQYVGPIAVTQNVRVNAAVIIDGIVSSDITSFQVDWFKVATPTYTWDADKLTATTTTDGATVEVSLTLPGDSVAAQVSGGVQTASATVNQDVHIDIRATKDGWTDADIVSFDYPYTEWSTLLTRIANAHDAVTAGTNNDNVPQTMVAELQVKIQEANVMYANRTAQTNAIHAMSDNLLDLTNAIMALVNAEDEPYAVLDGTTLTFYYDKKKQERGGMSVGPFDIPGDRGWEEQSADITTVVFDDSFADCTTLTSTAMWLYGFQKLTTITGINNLKTGNVTDMQYMFHDCNLLTSIDLSGFNTANVTNTSGMFYKCHKLATLDLSAFNTTNVQVTSWMFYGCYDLVTIYVGSAWSTASVGESEEMFIGCTALVGGMGTVYDANHVDATYAHIDGGTANPGYLTSANAPSSYTVTLKAVGNGTVKTADITVANGGEQDIAVAPGASLTLAFTPDAGYRLENVTVDDTDVTSQVTADSTGVSYYTLMSIYAAHTVTATFVNDTKEAYAVLSADSLTVTFYYDGQKTARGGMDINGSDSTPPYSSATTAVIDASFADYYPTSTAYWFLHCPNLTSIDGMANLKTGNVTDMRSMFRGCFGLTSLDVSGFNTANVTDMRSMFSDCSSLTSLDVSGFNTANVTNMFNMFYGCSGLTSLDLSGFNTANVTYMGGMFWGCSGLTSLDLSGFSTANVTNMGLMFDGCSGLTSLDLSSFNTANVTGMGYMFDGCSGLTSLDLSSFNTANVTSMASMFWGCSGLTSLDLSGFNTANVTDMRYMFYGCSGLTSLDLSGFNTANVTSMSGMFDGCSGLTSLDVSGFNTANVTYMSYMFSGCSGLTSLDLNGFNTANVLNMGWMFRGCSGLTTIYVGEEWSTANVTESSDMFTDCTALVGGMGTVYDANHVDAAYAHIDGGTANPGYLTSVDAPSSYTVTLKAVGNGTVKAADITVANGGEQNIAVARGASLTLAFTPDAGYRLENVTVDDTDVTSQVTADSTGVLYYTLMSVYAAHTVTATFVNDTKEAYAVLSADSLTVTFYYDTQKQERGGMDINGGYVDASPYGSATTAVIDASFADYYPTSTAYWFFRCSNLTSIDGMANLKTGNVTSMWEMFYGCSGLTSLDVSGFNTANVTDMGFMFDGCYGLTSLDVSGFNTANVTSMHGMFRDCSGLTSLDVSGFNTANVKNMYEMFMGCSGLTSLDVSGFNTANVTGMTYMFYGCSGLTSLDVSGFNTANVTDMSGMFSGCSGLTSLDVSSFNTANVTGMSWMFDGCSGLTSLDLSGFNTANVTIMNIMFGGCSNLTTIYVGEGWNTEKVTESTWMFNSCTALVGGAWTAYDAAHTDAAYAHIDGGTANPGYLTSAADATEPAVVTYSRVGHTVTLSSATANVHIMYTLSTWPFADDEPQWQQYTDPLALTEDCTITAYAVRPSGLRSADTEYNFVLNANFVEAPTIARDGEENRVVITNNSTTGTVYYNYDANGQLTATNSSQYVGPIDVSQNVRINAAVIIDGVVSSDITSFTVDWFKVATPTYTWDADKLTATTTTDGATVEVSLTLPGDSVAAQVSGGVQTASATVEQDVRIDIRATKDGWTDADVVSFDYPYTAWMQLMQAVDHGHQTMAAAATSDKVDTVSPDAPYARLNALLTDAEGWYEMRIAERLDIEELTARIQMTIAELEQEMNAVDEFAYDADNGVLHVYGNGLLEDALAAAGGREEVAQTLTAILWDKTETPLTDDMLQGLTGNPNLLIYVPTIEQAPVTVHNVVVGDRAEDILLVDAKEGNSNFYCPRTFMADRISYTRSFTQQTQVGVTRGWESIVLPFTVQTVSHESHGLLAPFGSSDSDQHFWLRQLSADGLERATQIEAYRPYLISMPNDSANYSAASCHAGRVTFSATGAMVEAGAPQETMLADDSRILIGTMKRVPAAADIYVLNVGQPEGTYLEGSIFVSHLREVRPFECYTLHAGGGSRYIGFGELDGSATLGIDGLTFDGMPQEQWFTLDGMKLQQRPAAKGVYILNGRKVVIK